MSLAWVLRQMHGRLSRQAQRSECRTSLLLFTESLDEGDLQGESFVDVGV